MGITIIQVNIRHWQSNAYIFQVELSNYNPDIVLLNSIGTDPSYKLKVRGYNVISKSEGPSSGVAILVKNNLSFESIVLPHKSIIAIKLKTTLGPVVIATAYIPPRVPAIPTISLHRIFKLNLPTFLAGDFNAQHQFFFNTYRSTPYGNSRGTQLYNFVQQNNLSFLGPYFHTYFSGGRSGKPDLVIVNRQFNMLHNFITPGNRIGFSQNGISSGKPVGSDHIPIIIKFQLKPFKIVTKAKHNYSKLDRLKYKEKLEDCQFSTLDGKSVADLENNCNSIFEKMLSAAKECSPLFSIKPIKSYVITPSIKLKLKQFQAASLNHYETGFPSIVYLNRIKEELLIKISNQNDEHWKKLTDAATECHGCNSKFWKKIKNMQGNKKVPIDYLSSSTINEEDSEASDYAEERTEYCTDPQSKVNLMSKSWATVFVPNEGEEFHNPNLRKVKRWYAANKQFFNHDETVNIQNLSDDHPIRRQIEESEVIATIKTLKDKTPGPSGMTASLIKNVPPNFITGFKHLFDGILSSNFYPSKFQIGNLSFIPKPGKDHHDPFSYRPITLLEILSKVFEKLIVNRLLYYLGHNNLLTERQFAFRKFRSTQQALHFAADAIASNKNQNYPLIVATRDVAKAFDTVYHKALLYKLEVNFNLDKRTVAFFANYLRNRQLIPFFEGCSGPSIFPKAGVPQGSCFGPPLYGCLVNDCPQPLYDDTLQEIFADDISLIIRAPSKSKGKIKLLKKKTEAELYNIQQWEEKWRIKSNPEKMALCPVGCRLETLEALGGIQVNNEQILLSTQVTLLGCTFSNTQWFTPHINNSVNKAKVALAQLQAFRFAPPKIKLHLFKALVLPLLTYPVSVINSTCHTNFSKLQKVQNSALRFVYNVRVADRISSKSLHERAKLPPINVRIAKQSNKLIHKMKELFTPPQCTEVDFINYFSEFTLTNPPIKTKKRTIASQMKSQIYAPRYSNVFTLFNRPDCLQDYILPAPKFL